MSNISRYVVMYGGKLWWWKTANLANDEEFANFSPFNFVLKILCNNQHMHTCGHHDVDI